MALNQDSQGPFLTIDLNCIVANYRALQEKAGSAETAAVVKANAYGLGVGQVAPVLEKAGCKSFFVATLEEAVQMRSILPNADIHVLNGILPGWPEVMLEHKIRPVLNSLYQVNLWLGHVEDMEEVLFADLHIDTGMSRLGLSNEEAVTFLQTPAFSNTVKLDVVLSHLAAADTPGHPMNLEQLKIFQKQAPLFKGRRTSLAASSAIFLGPDYQFDMVRPGIALFGGNPVPGKPNPMKQVVRVKGRILQVRSVDTPQVVGYGATYQATGPTRIATVAIGYGDGYLRSFSNTGKVWIEAHEAQVVGRISMDLTTVDVTQVPENLTRIGALVDFIGPSQTIDQVAATAGTIDYEILTSLGARYHRDYIGGD